MDIDLQGDSIRAILNFMKMKYLLLLPILLASLSLAAQKPQVGASAALNIGRLYGKVIDATNKQALAYASVTVLRTVSPGKDSLINGGITEENGDFNITGLPLGALKIRVSFVGNKDLIKMVKLSMPNNLELDLGNLPVEADVQMLNAVEITAEKATTTLSLEKRVFNVGKNITSTGGTAEDVLKNVPSVTVDMDGNVKLRDRGTTIYVNGKPTLMALTQIPSDQIESVEVISNPSSKYEASATGGILNIVMKKNLKPGYNGMVALGAGTQDRYNGMLNLNANQGKWSASGFYSINASKVPTNAYVNRTNRAVNGEILNYFNQNTKVAFENVFQSGRLNVDYAINNRNTLSLGGTVADGVFNIATDQDYRYLNASRQLTSYGTRQTLPKNNFKNNNLETQWRKTYAKRDKSLTALMNYSWGTTSNVASWNTTGFAPDGLVLPHYPELVDIKGANKNAQGVFQLDYVNPVNDSSKVEMGLRSFWSARDQNYFYSPFNYEQKLYIQDNQFSQDNRVTESINAAYISYATRLKHKISVQAGLRFEQSNMKGVSNLVSMSDFGYSYPRANTKDLLRSLFPSLYIAKKLDARTEIGANFSRKIQRPRFQQLMPGIQASDKQNLQIGNPNLQPEFIDLVELNYNKIFGANNFLSTLYLANETNTLKPLIRPSETDPTILVTSFVNGKNELMYGLDNTLKLAFGKNLDLMLNANVFNFKVTVDTFVNSGWSGSGKANLTYRLPANFSVQLNSGYEGNRPIPQGNRKGIVYLDFAVKKSFFNNAANVVFTISDVFNSRKEITYFDQATYFQESMRRRDIRFYKVTLQIPFGKADAAMFKRLKAKRPEGGDQPDFSGN